MANAEFKKFLMLEKSLPWLRGMSTKQSDGCNNLLHALRDDLEQGSTYRVRQCLIELGLRPMVTSKQLKAIMSISQANDLAFLWFLWEANYKQPHSDIVENDRYSINEQLILTAIAHLDMPLTMRALDEMLPTSEFSANSQNQVQHLRESHRDIAKSKERIRNCRHSPYLIPQRRPKLYKPKSNTSKPSTRKVIFPEYSKYKDKMYRISNENSRWFATYELSPVKREILRCFSDALAPLFNGKQNVLEKSVCNMHRILEFTVARNEQELAYRTTQRCIQLLHGQKEQQRRKYIIRQLEHDVDCAAEKLQKESQLQFTKLQQIFGGSCNVGARCQMCSNVGNTSHIFPHGSKPGKRADLSFLLDIDFNISHPRSHKEDKADPVKVYEVGEHRLMRMVYLEDDLDEKNTLGSNAYCRDTRYKNNVASKCPPTEGIVKIMDSKARIKTVKSSIEDTAASQECLSVDDSEDKYCSRKMMVNGIVKWNFFNVYEEPKSEKMDEQLGDTKEMVRKYCIEALNKSSKKPKLKIVRSETTLEAAEECFKGMLPVEAEINAELIQPNCEKDTDDNFKHITSIDPNDSEMLLQLLKQAIDILKCDRRYVLATLPNAHLMPVLLDWIAERYGKIYSIDEMNNLSKGIDLAYGILYNRIEHKPKVEVPNRKLVAGYNRIEAYDKYDEISRKGNKMKREYHDRLNALALDESRRIWLAMCGYANLGGSVTDTIFAYLPSKELDLMRHNIWQSNEYRDLKSMRLNRKLKYKFMK